MHTASSITSTSLHPPSSDKPSRKSAGRLKKRNRWYKFEKGEREKFLEEFASALASRAGVEEAVIRRLFDTRFDGHNTAVHTGLSPNIAEQRLAILDALSFQEKDDQFFIALWRLTCKIDAFNDMPYIWRNATNEAVAQRLTIPFHPIAIAHIIPGQSTDGK
ncbi:hypothetical protein BJ508DRAFT_320212 [Ascobolus immersus RN42]|uniref:Uncharacterized protein n=1 Tax=Ascobolus immersus RN42 TaxID=1160509 RepID=A0A3N4IRQ5_ASCIM|nr:hypothetical protein BJ508DRAFT_320212 [Ascobolus immersus RN42]